MTLSIACLEAYTGKPAEEWSIKIQVGRNAKELPVRDSENPSWQTKSFLENEITNTLFEKHDKNDRTNILHIFPITHYSRDFIKISLKCKRLGKVAELIDPIMDNEMGVFINKRMEPMKIRPAFREKLNGRKFYLHYILFIFPKIELKENPFKYLLRTHPDFYQFFYQSSNFSNENRLISLQSYLYPHKFRFVWALLSVDMVLRKAFIYTPA